METVAGAGAVLAAVIVAVLRLILDRRDIRKAQEREISNTPDSLDFVRRARNRVRRIRAESKDDFQP